MLKRPLRTPPRTHAWTRVVAVVFVLLVVLHPPARAEGPPSGFDPHKGTTLVIPVTRAERDLDRLAEVTLDVERVLQEQGVRVVPYATAARAFVARHSRESQLVTDDDLDALHREARLATHAAANKRVQEAFEHMQRVRSLVDDVLESLNRDAEAAKALFKVCVAHVRALVDNNNLTEAKNAARECKVTVPDLSPKASDAPPAVLRIFDEVDEEMRQRASMLLVDSEPGPCNVRVQGRPLGATPFREREPAGQYRVQVECGDTLPGRVHVVTVGDRPAHVTVDTVFEAAVHTSGDLLRLTYEHLVDSVIRMHALKLARVFHATNAVVVASPQPGKLDVRYIVGEQEREGGSAIPFPDPYTPETLRTTIRELLALAVSSSAVTEQQSLLDEPTLPEPPTREHRIRLATGSALLALGGVVAGLSAWQFRAWLDEGVKYRSQLFAGPDELVRAHDDWNRARVPAYALAGTSSVLAAAALATLAPVIPPKTRRWLTPLATAAGTALIVAGAVQLAHGAPCSPQSFDVLASCTRNQEDLDRGAILMIGSLPFLTLSTVHLVGYLRRDRAPHVMASARQIHLFWRF